MSILNEVLSLNAQECPWAASRLRQDSLLNEVLSLNAQEFRRFVEPTKTMAVLNEVLSLNAQEFEPPPVWPPSGWSSMKS